MILSTLIAFSAAQIAAAAPSHQPLRRVECDFPVSPERQGRVTCYKLRVPRDHEQPNGPTYELAVGILSPVEPQLGADPVLLLHGGPGGPGVVASLGRMRDEFLPGVQTVAFDQRANGRSDPKICENLTSNAFIAMAGPGDYVASARRYNAPYLECRAQFAAAGVAPQHFGTRVISDDAEALRRALRVRRWNIMSVSAGTIVALDMIAARPRTIRSAVLDSPVPNGTEFRPTDADYDATLEQFFSKCRADAACAGANPSLAEDFAEAVSSLNARPLAVPMPEGVPGGVFDLNGAELEYFVLRLMRSSASAAALPRLIAAAKARDTANLSSILRSAAGSVPANNVLGRPAVICRDAANFQFSPPPRRGPELANLYEVCRAWGPAGPPARVPRRLSVPILALSGGLDPLIGSQSAAQVGERLGSRARSVSFPSAGHGTWSEGLCPKQIVIAFFQDPNAPLDLSCVSAMPRPPLVAQPAS